jgi:uncharacterized protein YdeI (BOF family)
MMKILSTMLPGLVLAALLPLHAHAAEPSAQKSQQPDPYAALNNTWISISGEVKSVMPDSFTLDYGKGQVTVEMDDGDRDGDAYKLLAGDKVTVNGRVDDDFFERTTIEAASVYVEKLGTTFYASPVDEEDRYGLFVATTPVVVSSTVVQGVVTGVEDHEFTIDTGLRELTVETAMLGYDPLDDEGYQKIRAGDVVRVSGTIDASLFDGRELVARSLVKLSS